MGASTKRRMMRYIGHFSSKAVRFPRQSLGHDACHCRPTTRTSFQPSSGRSRAIIFTQACQPTPCRSSHVPCLWSGSRCAAACSLVRMQFGMCMLNKARLSPREGSG
ncbi:hypothetical protein IG631_18276 [Alternaria alternata]|nr:hypothetical protein IG631_18276 [Alternaria alternata]